MDRNGINITEFDFLSSAPVRGFVAWMEDKLDGFNAFTHHFRIKKTRTDWNCDSIYNAYENYMWSFHLHDPVRGTLIRGNTFSECEKVLDELSETLRRSISAADNELCAKTCCAILSWGGVLNRNDACIASIGSDICEYLQSVKDQMQKDLGSADYYFSGMKMNSGFTKIYSLCVNDFIIYDGRLGAALGLLSRLYCEENRLSAVSEELVFAWGRGKGGDPRRRDPSSEIFVYPELGANAKRHLENNIRANWLIKEITLKTASRFSSLEPRSRMRALESALFMIGYQVNPRS